jgi:serine phosphatase RsbU (regulator of sigma subunit)
VQTAFLSRAIPEDERFDISVKFRTARQLGGDFFDVRVIHDRLQVLVADVSGKGAPAALVTGLLSGLFSELSRRFHDPAKVLTILDKEIAPSLSGGMFITAFFLVVELDTGRCTYASAGHDPQILCSGKEVRELNPSGLPVGLLEGFELTNEVFDLGSGDKLVLFTDGIVNLKLPDGTRLGDEAIKDVVKENLELRAGALTEKIFSQMDERGELDDDAVVLVVARNS